MSQQQPKRFKIPWLTMASVLALIIQAVLGFCDIKLSAPAVNELITVICGMLAVAGVIAPKPDDTDGDGDGTDNNNNSDSQNTGSK